MKVPSARLLFRDQAVMFVAGAIFSVAVRSAIGAQTQANHDWLIALVSLFVMYTAFTFGLTKREIDERLNALSLTSVSIFEAHEAGKSFTKAREAVASAASSIEIISQYVSDDPRMVFPEGRVNYFQLGIEAVISKRLADPSARPLLYRRVIQVTDLRRRDGTLAKDMLKDDQLFEHCFTVFEMIRKTNRSNLTVDFAMTNPIPSFPSTMIIDDRHLFVAFSYRPSTLGTKEEQLAFAGSIIIEDHDGQTVRAFRNIIAGYARDGIPVRTVSKSENSA